LKPPIFSGSSFVPAGTFLVDDGSSAASLTPIQVD
jgi:hypothetical protein